MSRAAIIGERRITGLSADVIAELVAELGPLRHERHQARLASRSRKRAVGAGAKHRLVFVDRLLATLVHLRHAATHDVPACWFGLDRSTITRAIGEVRPLLAERGCTVSTGVRLRTLAEVIDHLGTSGKAGIIDGTEIRVRRPAAGRNDREVAAAGETLVRLNLVTAWRDATVFTEAERAALELAEQGTRVADAADGVSDEVWARAAKHYDEEQLTALVVLVSFMNTANRLNIIAQQPAGDYEVGQFR